MTAPRVPLPNAANLPEWVFFHREHPAEQRLILQVPDEHHEESETHVVNLEDTIHRCWIDGLKHSRGLMDLLTYAQHAAYCPRTGHVEEIPDLDTPSDVTIKFAMARHHAATVQSERTSRRRQVPAVSTLRQYLMHTRGVR
jgi:hypothetical protein